MTKNQITKRLNELNQRGLNAAQLRNPRYLATRKPLTPEESDEVVSYFKQSEISDFSGVVRAELSMIRRDNLGREWWPCFRLFLADGSWDEPSLRQATETQKNYVTRHLREAIEPEINEFMKKHRGMICHHEIPFAELMKDYQRQFCQTADWFVEQVKAGWMLSDFAKWHRKNAVLKVITKDQHYDAHRWKKPSGSVLPGQYGEELYG